MPISPMMQQYLNIKQRYEQCLLFYRVGDFYEMFFEDAKVASKELELVLTGKDCGLTERAPMCGVPHHAVNVYVQRLIEKGYKVAICEQLTEPTKGKQPVERDVIRIVTPGTMADLCHARRKDKTPISSACISGGRALRWPIRTFPPASSPSPSLRTRANACGTKSRASPRAKR